MFISRVTWCWINASSLSLVFSWFSTALSVAFNPTELLHSFHYFLLFYIHLPAFFGLFPLTSSPCFPLSSPASWAEFAMCWGGISFPIHSSHCTAHHFSFFPRINSANGLEIKSTGSQSLLMVANVTEEHYGNYTCVAANKLGVTNASLYLYSKYGRGWREALTKTWLCRKHMVVKTQEGICLTTQSPQTSSHDLAFSTSLQIPMCSYLPWNTNTATSKGLQSRALTDWLCWRQILLK